jgi:hypothetical protein
MTMDQPDTTVERAGGHRTPRYERPPSRFRRLFFGGLFVAYLPFVAACAAVLVIDRPWAASGGNIGSGFLGFFAALAAGFPWSLSGFGLMLGCERFHLTSLCDSFLGDRTFVFISAIGCVLNLWILGALARWWRFNPWQKRLYGASRR